MRNPSIYSPAMNAIQLRIKNESTAVFEGLTLTDLQVEKGQEVRPFDEIAELAPGASHDIYVHAKFAVREPRRATCFLLLAAQSLGSGV